MVDDALKHLYKSAKDGLPAGAAGLAEALGIDPAALTPLIDRMEALGFIMPGRHRPALTAAGEERALHLVRAHRLWERYLADHTGFEHLDWHSRAEVMEHEMTPEEVARLQAELGHPTHDPPGDPKPPTTPDAVSRPGRSLAEAPTHRPLRAVHVEDEPEDRYARLVAEDIHPGTLIQVEERGPEHVSLRADGRRVVLTRSDSEAVQVVPQDEEPEHHRRLRRTLADLPTGDEAMLVEIAPSLRGPERRRLLDLGFLPGTRVRAELVGAGGDPVAYRARGALVALRRSQTRHLYITDAPAGEGSHDSEAGGPAR
jgi:DtxR family Mn-dependent transcriptional regulator